MQSACLSKISFIVNESIEFVYDKVARKIIASLSKLNPQLLSSLILVYGRYEKCSVRSVVKMFRMVRHSAETAEQ